MNLLSDEEQLTAGIDRMLERQHVNEQPQRERVTAIAAEETQISRHIDRWVAQYADATDEELASLRAQVKAASKDLTARRAERAKLEMKLKAQAENKADREGRLAIAATLREGIREADHATRLYAPEFALWSLCPT